MKLGYYLSSKTAPELAILEEQLNLTDDEKIIFENLAKGRSNTKIAYDNSISVATLSKRIKAIKKKIDRIEGRCDH